MTSAVSLQSVNELSASEFIARFSDIAEHSPWVAVEAERSRPFPTHEALVQAFQAAVINASRNAQHDLILEHPDLAGRAALAGSVAAESRREQSGAGLDTLTSEEFERFHNLNETYRSRFGFPFIFAVSGATKFQILDAFDQRISGTLEEERLTAIAQILRIIRFRLETRVSI